jgi:L-threonylcarbamoyladenylate synthase
MKTINLKNTPIETVIKQTCKTLQSGGLVLFPTETTYGAGVDATNQEAVDKLLAYKSRREGKPLSILVANKSMAQQYVKINEQADKLYSQFLPGPVTVVSKSLNTVAKGVTSEFGTLGVRIPDYDLLLEISKAYGKPITATSANASGKKRPYSLDDIYNNLSEKQKNLVDLVLDAGTLPKNDPSTVIDTTLSTPVILRKSDREEHKQASQTDTKTTTIISNSELETKEIAGRIMLKNWKDIVSQGFVIALDGDLGMGKTIFTKGSAKFLNIEDTIKSPTYSYIEEYDYSRHQTHGQFFHLDMWKVEDQNMFERLEINKLIKPNNVVIIEWFSQVESYIKPILKNVKVVKITFTQIGENRKLEIKES